jgi:hypothetical protein
MSKSISKSMSKSNKRKSRHTRNRRSRKGQRKTVRFMRGGNISTILPYTPLNGQGFQFINGPMAYSEIQSLNTFHDKNPPIV